jgi:hypothetical protein
MAVLRQVTSSEVGDSWPQYGISECTVAMQQSKLGVAVDLPMPAVDWVLGGSVHCSAEWPRVPVRLR